MERHEPIWKELQLQIESDPKISLTVPSALKNPHRLIIQAKNILLSKDGKSFKYPEMQDATRKDGIDIRVVPGNVQRALRFMDTLIKVFESRGYEIKVNNRGTYAVVKGEEIKIACR